ncbi:AAA family ATPase, partial [Acidimicrobiaceae bacterium USS-CC1]|nr:AAA family ATPase [Acidiferrimicrobium australe]
ALGGDLHAAMRRLAAGHIDATAARIRPSRTWADLVLDPDREAQVREIAIRARHRETVFGAWAFDAQPSAGVVALFAGPSGTGKTLAAEIIAGDLGVDLYKIDLASLVSKYIGETEKNLSRVFETAEASNVVLFFDEADALLGKRSEVSDAHDRYANIEVAYLLQRLERYEGVAVMATNLARNIDDAFLRRIHVIVEFPVPEPPERRRIWARSVPTGAPVADDLDLDALADGVEISGGTIRNSVLTAAFLAAEAGTPITMQLAVTAVRRELQKLGRLASAADFRSLGSPP